MTDCLKTLELIRVCVLGHSFIRRLKDYYLTDVEPRATGGLTIIKWWKMNNLWHSQIHRALFYIQMGENDLANGVAVEKLSRDIISYANFLIDGCDIKTVVIGQFLMENWIILCRTDAVNLTQK